MATIPSRQAFLTGNVTARVWWYDFWEDVSTELVSVSSIVADGDKGDITVSSSGAVWSIDSGLSAAKIADGSVSNAEFQYLNGVTSAIQTQLDGKAASSHTHTASEITDFSTASRALFSAGTGLSYNSSTGVFASTITQYTDALARAALSASSPLSYNSSTGAFSVALADTSTNGYLSSTDWNTFNGKQASITGAATTITSSNLTASRALASDGSGKVAVSSVTSTELGYVSGVTSAIQTQINGKAATAHNHALSDITSGATADQILYGGSGGTSVTSTSGFKWNSASARLEIQGTSNQFRITNGTAYYGFDVGSSYVIFKDFSDGSESIQLNNSGYINFTTGSAERLKIDSTELTIKTALKLPRVSKSANYTLTDADCVILANAGAAAFDLTLPSATGRDGRTYIIIKVDGAANAVTIKTSGGSTLKSLTTQDKLCVVVSDGSAFYAGV